MKQRLRSTLVATAVGATLLTACDAPPPRKAVAPPVPSEAIPPGETLVEVVRKALDDVVRDPDPYSRARRLGSLIPTLGPGPVSAVKQTLEDPMLDLGATEIELLVRYWATHEPEAAASWAKETAPTSYRDAALFSVLTVWAEADPQAAVSAAWPWTEDLDLAEIVPIALVRGWFAANDPPGLRKFLSELPMAVVSQRAIATYIRVLQQTQGSEAVERWAESLPDDDAAYKLTVFRRVVDALAQVDMTAAIRWCDKHCLGPYGRNMRNLISRNWVLRDGPAALAWLSTAPEGQEKNFSVRITFALWSRTDREAAMAWMASQTTGEPAPWLEPIYPVYARLLSGDSPTKAIEWANRIKNERERELLLIGVARVWRHLDEAAAEQWLAQSSLSEEAKEKVRAPVDETDQPQPTS